MSFELIIIIIFLCIIYFLPLKKSSWYLFANMFTLCLIEKKKHKSVKKWRVKTEKLGVDEREFKRDKILKLKLLDG